MYNFSNKNNSSDSKIIKKILIINKTQFGYHTITHNYCKYLKDEYDISYICFDQNKNRIIEEGIKVIYFPNKYMSSRIGVMKFISFLKNYIKSNQIDLTFVKYFHLSPLLRVGLYSHPFILDIRTASIGSTLLRRKKANFLLYFESLFFKNITINSESLRNKLGIGAKKAHILPLGADELSKTDKSFEAINLLYVGVLSSRNIEDTVFALSKFINRNKRKKIDITYDIFGYGTKEAEILLTDAIRATGLDNIVTFHGAKSHTELQKYFDNCNIGVAYIPQVDYYECQPSTKIFEYVRAGLLTIATGTFENRRLITKENGILCSDNVDSFANALEEMYIHRDKFESQKIRETLKESSWDEIVNNNLKKYFRRFC